MDLRDVLNTTSGSSSSGDFFSGIAGRFRSNVIMSLAMTGFTIGIIAVVFLYVVLVFLKSL